MSQVYSRDTSKDEAITYYEPSDTVISSQKAIKTYVDEHCSYTAGTGVDITNDVISAKIATSVSSSSTNGETVGAKLFYDTCGDVETLINAL